MKRPLFRRAEPEVFTDRRPAINTATIVRRAGSDSLIRVGLRSSWWRDLYHRTLMLSWKQFVLEASVIYIFANIAFALLYLLQPGSIANAREGSFVDAFFFSVENFATLGYGVLSPATLYANWVMTFETLVGLMTVALTTGMMFARVSRPTARVLFSRVAVVTIHEGQPTLMVRMGNERLSQIVDATIDMSILRSEFTREGKFMRRFYDLALVRSRTPIFAMSFNAMHVIDENSPLFGLDADGLVEGEIELLVTVTGLDEIMGQTVHARASYLASEIRFSHRYVDIFGVTEDGRRAIDYRHFHETYPHAAGEQ